MEQRLIQKKQAVDFFLKKEILLSSDVLEGIDENDFERIYSLITNKVKSQKFLFLNKDLNEALQNLPNVDLNWLDLEKSKALLEKGRDNRVYNQFIKFLYTQKTKAKEEKVKVINSYGEDSKKRNIQDFVRYFNMRYKALENILRHRPDLKNIITINRIKNKRDRETVSLIGIVVDKKITKNKNIILTLEDQTGSINVLINKNKPEIFNEARSIVMDEILAIEGVNGNNIIFANKVFWPEVTTKELKKSSDDSYALFLSDLHVGSNNF